MAWTLASNRSRARRPDRLLDDDPDPATARTARPTRAGGCRSRPAARPRRPCAASTRCGATLTLATRSPLRHDLAVEGGEDLERVDPVEPLEVGDPDVERRRRPRRGGRPGSATGRAGSRPGPGHRRRQPERGLVLVQLARLGDEDADRVAGLGGGERDEVVRGQPPALRPARAADPSGRARGWRRRAGPGTRRPGVTRWTCTPMAGWRSVAS